MVEGQGKVLASPADDFRRILADWIREADLRQEFLKKHPKPVYGSSYADSKHEHEVNSTRNNAKHGAAQYNMHLGAAYVSKLICIILW